ncbi:MAG: transporter [Aquabacterium sp.]
MIPTKPVLPVHGAGTDGLIVGFWFEAGRPSQPVDSLEQAARWRAAGRPGFAWLHLQLGHAGTGPWIRQQTDLGEAFQESLDGGSRSTRIERDGEMLFAVMNDLKFQFGYEASDVSTLWIAVGPDRVISTRQQPLRSVDRLRQAVRRGEAIGSPVSLLDHLVRDQADELQAIVRQTAERVDDIEDALLAGRGDGQNLELTRLRRLMVRLMRWLALEPSALQRTLASPPAWVPPQDMARLQRASEEFALVLRDISALQERIKLMQDEVSARVAEDNNRSLFTLTMVTVLALPINLISGLFGMNVGGVPLSDHRAGFWIMVGVIGSLTSLIVWRVLRRLRGRNY